MNAKFVLVGVLVFAAGCVSDPARVDRDVARPAATAEVETLAATAPPSEPERSVTTPLAAPVADQVDPTNRAGVREDSREVEARRRASAATMQAVDQPPAAPTQDDGIPIAELGEPELKSVLSSMPGYEAADDPEANSVRLGRREVGPIEIELSNGQDSPEELAISVLECIASTDLERLRALGITEDEFESLCWPEFPESRPITGWQGHEAWLFFMRRNLAGSNRGLDDFAGQALVLDQIVYRTGRADFSNFDLYLDLEIHARTVDGEPVVLDFVRSFIERNGRWKIYSFKD